MSSCGTASPEGVWDLATWPAPTWEGTVEDARLRQILAVPTPIASDAGGGETRHADGRPKGTLRDLVGGMPDPEDVEVLMGAPAGWSDPEADLHVPEVEDPRPWTHVSLCSGIGLLDLGLHQAAAENGVPLRTLALVEHDPDDPEAGAWRRTVLSRRFPGARVLGDLLDPATLETLREVAPEPDVLTAGFPCEPYSTVRTTSERASEHAAFGVLAGVVSTIRTLRPRSIILENVPGFAVADGGVHWRELRRELVGHGYALSWQVVTASGLGAWHERARWFCVGRLGLLPDAVDVGPFPQDGIRWLRWRADGGDLTAGLAPEEFRAGAVVPGGAKRVSRAPTMPLDGWDRPTVPRRATTREGARRVAALGGGVAVPVARWVGRHAWVAYWGGPVHPPARRGARLLYSDPEAVALAEWAGLPRPEPPPRKVEPVSRMVLRLPAPSRATLIRGDVLDALETVQEASVGLVVTSPPYWRIRGVAYPHPNSWGSEDDVGAFLDRIADLSWALDRVVEPGGVVALNVGDRVHEDGRGWMMLPSLAADAFRGETWTLVVEETWTKSNGDWRNVPRPQVVTERVYVYVRRGEQHHYDGRALLLPAKPSTISWRRRKNRDLDAPTESRNSFRAPTGGSWSGARSKHPASWHPDVPERYIRLFSRPGAVVLDPFVGSGSSGVAAIRMARPFIGIDIADQFSGPGGLAQSNIAEAAVEGPWPADRPWGWRPGGRPGGTGELG